jgi:hypothetical protein
MVMSRSRKSGMRSIAGTRKTIPTLESLTPGTKIMKKEEKEE